MGRKVQAVMRRGPDGSSFITCEVCQKKIAAAILEMHDCKDDEAFKKTIERLRADYERRVEEAKAKNEAEEGEKPVKKAKGRKRTAKEDGDDDAKDKAKAKEKEKRREKKSQPKEANAPKRPPTAYFLFANDFRKTYKEEHPESKGVTEVAKAAGEKWKSMSEEEKKPYLDKAAELKKQHAEVSKDVPASGDQPAPEEIEEGDEEEGAAEGEACPDGEEGKGEGEEVETKGDIKEESAACGGEVSNELASPKEEAAPVKAVPKDDVETKAEVEPENGLAPQANAEARDDVAQTAKAEPEEETNAKEKEPESKRRRLIKPKKEEAAEEAILEDELQDEGV